MLGIAGMLTTGAVVASASSASAHTPSISATCEMLTVDLTGFQPTVPAKGPVTHEEYLFEHAPHGVYKTEWHSDINWNAQVNAQSTGWRLVEPRETRTVTDVPETPARTNHVTVTINGVTVADVDFGTMYSSTFPFTDKYQPNDWSVSWTAYDGTQWSGSAQGTTTACPPPVPPVVVPPVVVPPVVPPVVVPPVAPVVVPPVAPVVVPPVAPVVVPPVPPVVGGVKVTAPPEVEGVKHTAPAVAPTVEGVKHEAAAALPRTGTDAGRYGAAGLLLLMAGVGLVLGTRKHGRGRAH